MIGGAFGSRLGQGKAGRALRGPFRLRMSERGESCHGRLGKCFVAGRRPALLGDAGRARQSCVRHGSAERGASLHGRLGTSWRRESRHCDARSVMAKQAVLGWSRQHSSGRSIACQGRAEQAEHRWARRSGSWPCEAGQADLSVAERSSASLGKAGKAGLGPAHHC